MKAIPVIAKEITNTAVFLSKGENTITAQAQGGNPVSVKVTVQQQKAKISVNPVGESRIPADGRSNIDFQYKKLVGWVRHEQANFICNACFIIIVS